MNFKTLHMLRPEFTLQMGKGQKVLDSDPTGRDSNPSGISGFGGLEVAC